MAHGQHAMRWTGRRSGVRGIQCSVSPANRWVVVIDAWPSTSWSAWSNGPLSRFQTGLRQTALGHEVGYEATEPVATFVVLASDTRQGFVAVAVRCR